MFTSGRSLVSVVFIIVLNLLFRSKFSLCIDELFQPLLRNSGILHNLIVYLFFMIVSTFQQMTDIILTTHVIMGIVLI